MRAADGAARARREPDELARAALDAARDVRQVAREPEQLQLEAERERVDAPAASAAAPLVEQVEEPRERTERPLVRLRLAEEPQHRLGADQPDVQPVGVLAHRVVRAEELDAGDRLQLARPWWSISSTCESGSSRAPNRDFVLRTPFAIAPIRPRSSV